MPKITKTPSYLLKRGDIYYFRWAFPDKLKATLKKKEVRCSLATRERSEARKRAQKVYKALARITSQKEGDCWMEGLTYDDVKAIVYEALQDALEDDLKARHLSGKPLGSLEEAERESDTYAIVASDLEEDLAMNRYDSQYHWVDEILSERGMSLNRETAEYRLFARECLRAAISMVRIISHRYLGDNDFENKELLKLRPMGFGVATGLKESSQGSDVEQGIKLSEALDKYIQEKTVTGAWQPATMKDMIPTLRQFIDILDDMPCASLDRSHVRDYRETLLKLPSNFQKRKEFQGLSIEQIIATCSTEAVKPASHNTLNNKFTKVKGFLFWLENQGYTEATGLGNVLQNVRTGHSNARAKALFTETEIAKIFHPDNLCGSQVKKPFQFWVPLLGLYTGARLEELCQLHVEDVKQEGDVWYLDINEKGSKHVKTRAAIRKVPLHSALVEELGFMGFVESRRQQREERLFPELEAVGRTGRVSDKASRWFGRYLGRIGIKSKQDEATKCFHSFRGTFTNYCKQKGLEDKKVKEVVGHAHDGDITEAHYNAPYEPGILYRDVICKVDWKIDIEGLKGSPYACPEPVTAQKPVS